ncbi:hypothetical protein [Maribacter sp. HTCC2170]|uniref:hypothetical protein n=1 Tax=Maribacter sp. (strain HTCC2170 / KCCM 42371) TaxID=313603 RepID=UPI0011D2832E|nr:hypothetical protein [Maribacter sp. HTCC2170]
MKKLLTLVVLILVGNLTIAQENLHLIFEFMKVDESQQGAYGETESFWEKIHEQRVKSGDIIGWDLWALGPGGEDQGFQYLTVTLFSDPVKMLEGGDFGAALKAAYPNMSDDELNKTFDKTSKARDLAVRIFSKEISSTTQQFDMPLGCIAQIDLMKVALSNYGIYEEAEEKVFKPLHQQAVDSGGKESWGLIRFMSPIGSDTYASHMTVSMYKDYAQMLSANINYTEGSTPAQTKMMMDGLAARDMKYVYTARLIRKVR